LHEGFLVSEVSNPAGNFNEKITMLRLSRLLATMSLPSHAQGGCWRMPKALLLLLAFFLAACSVQARPPRILLGGMPARFVELPLDIGNGDEVTVRGEGNLLMTNFTAFFRTFCDTLGEVWRNLCGQQRCLPRPWRIFVLEKDPHTAVVAYPGREGQGDTAGDAVLVIFRAYRLEAQGGAGVPTSESAATEVARYLTAPDESPRPPVPFPLSGTIHSSGCNQDGN